ncbi:hypothetical protein NDU88_000807 [Pleurodeles waltl]|uniref:NADH dehydrogenase [ubiquinone] 1 beta subcomplex subunit 11, mitochondrial n=1 Tax=Pleurodeles waltl TaxID=8319 RepID=A0AAV7LXE5_PLEWA|nr:hypothetical protein NDU88_000807 [Pleurodeles waltl]
MSLRLIGLCSGSSVPLVSRAAGTSQLWWEDTEQQGGTFLGSESTAGIVGPSANFRGPNPDFHGFSDDPHVDLWNMRLAFFTGISLCIVLGSVFVRYLPDRGLREWARREAEKKIREREALGLPLIDIDYYDPSKLVLPTDEK